jgi:O-antigen ligase
MYVGLGCLVLGAILQGFRIDKTPGFYWGIALAAWIVVAIFYAKIHQFPGVELKFPNVAFAWLMTPLVALAAMDPKRRVWMLRAFLLAACIALVFALLQFCIGLGTKGVGRIDPNGPAFRHSTGLSALHLSLAFAGSLLLMIFLQPSKVLGIDRVTSWVGRGVAIILVLIPNSRAGMLGAISGTFSSLVSRGGRRWISVSLAITVALILAVFLRLWFFTPERLDSMITAKDGRLPIWKTTVHLIKENPILGCGGRKAYKTIYDDAYRRVNPEISNEFPGGAPHAHNTQLAIGAEFGIPAILLHAGFYAAILLFCWRHRHLAPEGWRLALGVVTVIFVGGLFEPYATQAVPGFGGAAVLGIALGLVLEGIAKKQKNTLGPTGS